ncbi:hypothetical protein ACNUDN_00685 [Mycobacterium sp. smrl_JER01]|uniref:hypothetical protein n=1 Tax=Mycobacterium sp. smrl_JER01 TaxID=3402633 RepID=UPI003AD19842
MGTPEPLVPFRWEGEWTMVVVGNRAEIGKVVAKSSPADDLDLGNGSAGTGAAWRGGAAHPLGAST